jgi:hypothetical protein
MKLTLVVLSLICCAASTPLPAPADSDVVVKKNSDGTVEAFDAPGARSGSPASTSTPAKGAATRHRGGGSKGSSHSTEPPVVNVHYRLYNPVGTRHINGVTVRTNPDGSIETLDEDSSTPAPVHHAKAHPKQR